MLDIILYISSSITEQAYYMHVLEILSFMLREQSASELAGAALQRSQTEKIRDQAELVAIRERENVLKRQKARVFTGTRHSRFGGTYVVKSMKSISDNDLIYHKPLSRLDDLNFDADKQTSKTPKNRVPIHCVSTERRSAFSIRLFLKEFCIEFLNAAYNILMHEAKRALVRQKAQAHDESYYLWALRFFMEFNRNYKKFEVKLVSETMSVQTFHFVQQQSETYFDMIQTDKKKLRLWSRRLHLSLLAYRELLMTLCAMDKSNDEDVKQSSKVIKSNIFYVLEYRELILTLLLTYDELKMSDAYLNDLMETQHIFLKMLHSYSGGSDLVVQAKSKGRRKGGSKKKSQPRPAKDATVERSDPNAVWDSVAPQLSVVLEGSTGIPGDIVPFDATSDVPIDEQKSEAMKNIQKKLRNGEFEEAVGLLRAAREVWPENDSFGSNNMAPEEEFLALKDIFCADLGVEFEGAPNNPEDGDSNGEDEEDEEEEVERSMQISESDFKFEDFAKRLAHPKIIRACGLALKKFDKNSALTNHCIVKLLHRVAWDCKMPAMVFQVSIFRTFQRIYELRGVSQYRELVKFADYIVKEFVKVTATNSKVYIEALFWKNSKDAYDIEMGYGASTERSQAATRAWTELEEEELRKLFMEHKEKELEEDPVDWIVGNLIDNTKTRRAVLKKLKEMYLLADYKGPRKSGISARTRVPKQWGEDEEEQLKDLFNEFKGAADPLGCIMDRLDVKRPKNRIVEKILELGLASDRKELRKKRTKKSESGKSGKNSADYDPFNNSDADIDSNSDSEIENLPSSSHIAKPVVRKTRKNSKRKASNRPSVSYGEVLKLVSEVENSGMSEAIEWLRESFADVAEDLENNPDDDDDESGIPLVPILDCATSAVENELFLKLLKGFGVKEPADEQEQYWRIPNQLTDNIQRFLNGEQNISTIENKEDEAVVMEHHLNLKDDTNEGESSSQKSQKKKITAILDSDENDESSREPIVSIHPSQKKKITAILDSDEDQEREGEDIHEKMRKILDSDEEGESKGKRTRISDSDTETPIRKRSKALVSDDDDE